MNLNASAPDFLLPDLNGMFHRLSQYRGQIVVINFWSAECGWSEESDSEIQKTSAAWNGRVCMLRVASNANESDEMLKEASHARNLDIVLKDTALRQAQDTAAQVADLYAAQTTPHLFVVDENGILRYRGAFNDRTFRRRVATKFYLREALDALLAGRLPVMQETQPYGCTIVKEF